MYQDIFILGARGNVGKTLIKQIYENGIKRLPNISTRIVGLGEYDCFHFDSSGISRTTAGRFLSREGAYRNMENLNSLLDFVLESYGPSNGERSLVFADVTNARDSMGKFHLRVISETPFSIVTSNKHPLISCSFDEFKRLTREPRRYGYRCSVMAGAEAVDKIRDLRDLGDSPLEISGCFSGTLGYICTELEKGRKLSGVVKEARKEGYTEPNPADDLDGGDVERKIIILSRTAGFDVPKTLIKRIPFIPESYLVEKNIEKFLDCLSQLDELFLEKVSQARQNNNVLRYIAKFDNSNGSPKINVGLLPVERDSPLGSLSGTANKVVIRTKTYDKIPYSVKAPGAGLEITAQNIRRDLLNQMTNRLISFY